MKNCLRFVFLLAVSFLLFSCNVDVKLKLTKTGAVDIVFSGSSGEAFSKMILSSTGGEEFFDKKEIGYELAKAGFSNVKVDPKKGTDLVVTMSDLKKTSYLFTSGILKVEKGQLKTNITAKSLKDFYASADEQTKMILDLFLAPVFNDEEMSESEYIEMLGTIYGQEAAKEVLNSSINLEFTDEDGSKRTEKIAMSGLMCGGK